MQPSTFATRFWRDTGAGMRDAPRYAADYHPSYLALVRAALLQVALVLNDHLDAIVVVGGVVPSLIVPIDGTSVDQEAHPGTTDLDLALSLLVFEEERYEAIATRLRQGGFEPDVNDEGRPTRQRWRASSGDPVTIDFLIPPTGKQPAPGRVKGLTKDLGAFVIDGLDLAHQDRVQVTLEGITLRGAHGVRTVAVCGPAAFVVLKALAHQQRGLDKDAFDLHYILKHHGGTVAGIARRLAELRPHPAIDRALEALRANYARSDGFGPTAVAMFLTGRRDDDIEAEARAFVQDLLRELARQS